MELLISCCLKWKEEFELKVDYIKNLAVVLIELIVD